MSGSWCNNDSCDIRVERNWLVVERMKLIFIWLKSWGLESNSAAEHFLERKW